VVFWGFGGGGVVVGVVWGESRGGGKRGAFEGGGTEGRGTRQGTSFVRFNGGRGRRQRTRPLRGKDLSFWPVPARAAGAKKKPVGVGPAACNKRGGWGRRHTGVYSRGGPGVGRVGQGPVSAHSSFWGGIAEIRGLPLICSSEGRDPLLRHSQVGGGGTMELPVIPRGSVCQGNCQGPRIRTASHSGFLTRGLAPARKNLTAEGDFP